MARNRKSLTKQDGQRTKYALPVLLNHLRAKGAERGSVDRVFQAFACLELRLRRGLDLHRCPRARIATGRGLALRDGKAAKANEAHFVTLLQRGGDAVKYTFDSLRGIGLGKAGCIGDSRNQILLVHSVAPLSKKAQAIQKITWRPLMPEPATLSKRISASRHCQSQIFRDFSSY